MVVFGIEKVDYISKKTNKPVQGLDFHCVSDYMETDVMKGQKVDHYFVSVRSQGWASVQGINIGDDVRALYNRFGQVEDILLQKPAPKAAAAK